MKRERRERSRLCVALNLGVTADFDSGPPKNVLGTVLHHSVGGGVQILGKALHILQISGSRWILGGGNSGDKGDVEIIWAITEATFSFEVNQAGHLASESPKRDINWGEILEDTG